MKHKLLILSLTIVVLMCSSQTSRADVDTLNETDGWQRLTQMPDDDWESYYYVIADYANQLMMQMGMGANQDAKYNAMWYQSPKDPLIDQTVLWTMEKNVKSDGSKTYALLRNVAYDKYFMQTEADKAYLFHTHDNGGGDKVWGRIEITPVVQDGEFKWFTLENGRYPASGSTTYKGYIGPWNDVSGDNAKEGYEVAANKLNTFVGHFIIYAIKKENYQLLTEARFKDASTENPKDVTFLIKDQNMELGAASVWKGLSTVGGDTKNRNGECGVGKTFNISQTLTDIPNGMYQFRAQGFYRAGSRSTAGAAHAGGTEALNAMLYANAEEVPLMSVHEYMKTSSESGFLSATTAGETNVYIPNTQGNASLCFSDGYYENVIEKVMVTNGVLTIGVKSEKVIDGDWACYDNFRLYYLGNDIAEFRRAALDQIAIYEEELLLNPDPVFETAIQEAKTIIAEATDIDTINEALKKVEEAYKYHLSAATPTDKAIDLTQMITNADLSHDTNSWTTTIVNNEGYSQTWTAYSPGMSLTPSVLEVYAGYSTLECTSYTMTQDVPLNTGTYRLRGSAFYRNPKSTGESLAQLVAGDAKIDVAKLNGITNIADIIPYALPNNIHEASEAFGAGNYMNELVFTVENPHIVTLGYVGTHDAKLGWFIAGPVTLEKISESVLANEAAKMLADAKEIFAERKAIYQSIASQHVAEGIIFNIESAEAMADAATTVDEVESAIMVLGKELVAYMNQFEASDLFDFTSVIRNPGFEIGTTEGWSHPTEDPLEMGAKPTSGRYGASNMSGNYLFNTWTTSSTTAYDHYLLQRIDYLPSGEYTLSAVVGGSQADAAMRLVANSETTDYIRCTADAVGVPVSLTFNNETPGAVRIGVKSNRWFKADDFRLTYAPFRIDDWMAVDLETINLENDKVQAFLQTASYTSSNTASIVASHANGVSDRPRGVKIHVPHLEQEPTSLILTVSDVPTFDGTGTNTRSITLNPTSSIYNLYNTTPGYTYLYKVEADGVIVTQGIFTTEGTVRMIYTEKGSNIRDLGGRKTQDKKIVRYGRLYRGGEMHAGSETTMTDSDLAEMKRLDIGAEIDLRCLSQTFDVAPAASAIDGADYIYLDQQLFGSDAFASESDRERYRKAFTFMASHMRENRNVYFHCIWGADRTGALAFLVESMMGWSLDDMYKDYELTSFSKAGIREKSGLDSKISYLEQNNQGETLRDKTIDFLVNTCGVSQTDIQTILDYMLEEDPTAVETIEAVSHLDNVWYDLTGRAVTYPVHGVYIRNGKKVIVK